LYATKQKLSYGKKIEVCNGLIQQIEYGEIGKKIMKYISPYFYFSKNKNENELELLLEYENKNENY
jgi:hypothetical protein